MLIPNKLNQNKILTITAMTLAVSCSTIAQASDGFYINSNISNSTFSHTIERNTGTNETPSITTRTEETDFGLGLNVGYKFHVADSVYLAGELFYSNQDIETRNINNLLITDLSLNNTYGLKAKLGFDITDNFSIYGMLGQTTLDFDINNSYPFAPPLTDDSTDVDEITIGVGAEFLLNEQWGVTVEYSQLNDVSFDPIPEVAVPGKINDNELDLTALTFGLSYRF